jgi:hypothetical protein
MKLKIFYLWSSFVGWGKALLFMGNGPLGFYSVPGILSFGLNYYGAGIFEQYMEG